MQVSLETTTGLGRRLKVELPAANIEGEVATRLIKLQKTAQIKGFRPGKVPASLIKRNYGMAVRYEVVEELMRKSLGEALEQEKLKPAGMPQVEAKKIEEGQPFAYEAVFEVFPEIHLKTLENVQLQKEVVDITEQDIDVLINKLRKQYADRVTAQRPAKTGDQVVIDFSGRHQGRKLEKATAKDFAVELGSGRLIPGFEASLLGKKAGDEFTVELKFPEIYPDKELAGQLVEFTIKVHEVLEEKLQEINSEFVKKMGVKDGSVPALRDEIKENLQQHMTQELQNRLKQQVLQKLVELNPIDLPQTLVDEEVKHLQEAAVQESRGRIKVADLPLEPFKKQAANRVHVGLLMNEVIQQYKLAVDETRLRRKIEGMAGVYEDAEKMVNWYYNNQEILPQIKMSVLEDQAVDQLLEQATVQEVTKTYQEIAHDHEHGHDHDHHDHDHDHHGHDHAHHDHAHTYDHEDK